MRRKMLIGLAMLCLIGPTVLSSPIPVARIDARMNAPNGTMIVVRGNLTELKEIIEAVQSNRSCTNAPVHLVALQGLGTNQQTTTSLSESSSSQQSSSQKESHSASQSSQSASNSKNETSIQNGALTSSAQENNSSQNASQKLQNAASQQAAYSSSSENQTNVEHQSSEIPSFQLATTTQMTTGTLTESATLITTGPSSSMPAITTVVPDAVIIPTTVPELQTTEIPEALIVATTSSEILNPSTAEPVTVVISPASTPATVIPVASEPAKVTNIPEVGEVTTAFPETLVIKTTIPEAVIFTTAIPEAVILTTAIPEIAKVTTTAIPEIAKVTTTAIPEIAKVTTAIPEAVVVTTASPEAGKIATTAETPTDVECSENESNSDLDSSPSGEQDSAGQALTFDTTQISSGPASPNKANQLAFQANRNKIMSNNKNSPMKNAALFVNSAPNFLMNIGNATGENAIVDGTQIVNIGGQSGSVHTSNNIKQQNSFRNPAEPAKTDATANAHADASGPGSTANASAAATGSEATANASAVANGVV